MSKFLVVISLSIICGWAAINNASAGTMCKNELEQYTSFVLMHGSNFNDPRMALLAYCEDGKLKKITEKECRGWWQLGISQKDEAIELEDLFGEKYHLKAIAYGGRESLDRYYVSERLYNMHNSKSTCHGKEWELGQAIQITHRPENDVQHRWHAQLGTCINGTVQFGEKYYFDHSPNVTELNRIYMYQGPIHQDPWHQVTNKSRTFYVFEHDWLLWKNGEDGKIAALSAINMLLLNGKKKEVTIFSPENPMPGIENEGIISLSDKAWQHIYPDGALFVQIEVRVGGAKVKFLQKFTTQAVPFAVYRDIPTYSNWIVGKEPFDLSKTFSEYRFGPGFAPIGEQTHWSAQIYLQ